METPSHEMHKITRCNSCLRLSAPRFPRSWTSVPFESVEWHLRNRSIPERRRSDARWCNRVNRAKSSESWLRRRIDVGWITRIARFEEDTQKRLRQVEFHVNVVHSPKSTGRITGPSSVTPPTMFGHVFLRLFGRFYPRKLLGHDALNEYLRRADRSWYSEATIGRNAPINSNVRGLRGIDVAGKGTNDDHDADDQDGDDDHDARDNAVSMVVRRKKGPRPCR